MLEDIHIKNKKKCHVSGTKLTSKGYNLYSQGESISQEVGQASTGIQSNQFKSKRFLLLNRESNNYIYYEEDSDKKKIYQNGTFLCSKQSISDEVPTDHSRPIVRKN